MSQFSVILALIFSLIIAVFAVANNQPIVVNYIYGKTEVFAVIVILGAAFLGALSIFVLSIFKQIVAGFRLRGLQGEMSELRSRLQQTIRERDALLLRLGQLQEGAYASPELEVKADIPSAATLENVPVARGAGQEMAPPFYTDKDREKRDEPVAYPGDASPAADVPAERNRGKRVAKEDKGL